MNKLLGLAAVVSFAAASSAWAAGSVQPAGEPDPDIEVVVVTGKRPAPEGIYEVVVTAKRPGMRAEARTPPVLPLAMPRLVLAVGGPPVVRL